MTKPESKKKETSEAIDDSSYSKYLPDTKRLPDKMDLLILFFTFIFVSSDVFLNVAMNCFTGAIKGTQLTFFGVIIQSISLIIIYCLIISYI